MICRFYKIDSVEWETPTDDNLTGLMGITFSKCSSCGAINAQVVEQVELDDFELGIKGEDDERKTTDDDG